MTALDKIKDSDIRYSAQAVGLIANLRDNFDVDAFEVWMQDKFIVGGGHILEFLQEQAKKDAAANHADPITPPAQ